jgi:hypothetical protein
MSLPPDKRELPLEDLAIRDPEWEVLGRGAADQGEGRQFWWDPIHGWVCSTGPIVQVTVPPNHLRPY